MFRIYTATNPNQANRFNFPALFSCRTINPQPYEGHIISCLTADVVNKSRCFSHYNANYSLGSIPASLSYLNNFLLSILDCLFGASTTVQPPDESRETCMLSAGYRLYCLPVQSGGSGLMWALCVSELFANSNAKHFNIAHGKTEVKWNYLLKCCHANI